MIALAQSIASFEFDLMSSLQRDQEYWCSYYEKLKANRLLTLSDDLGSDFSDKF